MKAYSVCSQILLYCRVLNFFMEIDRRLLTVKNCPLPSLSDPQVLCHRAELTHVRRKLDNC